MSVLDSSALSGVGSSTLPSQALNASAGLLREVPRLLEYRAEADPDAEFIPKTIAGFAGGFLVMSACLAMGWVLLMPLKTHAEVGQKIMTLMAFMLGVDGVASSLLLVALKVRADHTEEYLYARHWLNSLGTGALYATMIMGPWILLQQQGFTGNRFVAAAVWMLLMAFPAVAAKWTVEPHPHKDALA